jgi:hypothetical protein
VRKYTKENQLEVCVAKYDNIHRNLRKQNEKYADLRKE